MIGDIQSELQGVDPYLKLLFKTVKVKQSLNTPMGGAGRERLYSSYSFTTSALDGGI
jgi:hypothetical protein